LALLSEEFWLSTTSATGGSSSFVGILFSSAVLFSVKELLLAGSGCPNHTVKQDVEKWVYCQCCQDLHNNPF